MGETIVRVPKSHEYSNAYFKEKSILLSFHLSLTQNALAARVDLKLALISLASVENILLEESRSVSWSLLSKRILAVFVKCQSQISVKSLAMSLSVPWREIINWWFQAVLIQDKDKFVTNRVDDAFP